MPAIQPTDPRVPDERCPLTTALTVLGGKWALICLYWLAEQDRHFAALRRLMPGISVKVLTDTLRRLEQNGLVDRKPRGDSIDHVDYSISAYGRRALAVVEAMRDWGTGHIAATG